MKPLHLAIISFTAGAVIAGSAVYMLKPQQAAVADHDLIFLNKKMMESSFPALRSAKGQVHQAMQFFESRKDEKQTTLLCSEAIANYLSVIRGTLERGDMDFMADAIQQDRDAVIKFLDINPQLKQTKKEN